eukprot:CAMPEP_0113968012 /NCGR_PEP_ID=MMETSP0011_2-20120614/9265_1 /TAXON_ID=101924 /ORGANISM="Rhodosorus marinus" /LENGTH=295 /DNA_ID=CAMNT_0000980991 /DNA_START=155 /DNA_END=1043 /DNA_ORIENTATION=- /assembly_acc=CAM_ASM_000156
MRKDKASKGDEDVEDVSGDESNRNRPVSSGAESNGGVPPETSTPSSEEQPGSANEPVHRISPFASDITPNPNGLPNPVEELELESSKEVSSLESVDRAKSQLRRLLPYVINLDRQRAKVEKLIKFLEQQGTTPLTNDFTEMGLSGRWNLLYTTTTLGTPSTGLRLRKVEQEFDIEAKKIRNHVLWSFLDEDCHGQFTIIINYQMVGSGRLHLKVEDYILKPQNKIPKDPVLLSENLQRALPREFFDPDNSWLDVTYIDPNFRIARYMGKRYAGVRNILDRVPVESPQSSPNSEQR